MPVEKNEEQIVQEPTQLKIDSGIVLQLDENGFPKMTTIGEVTIAQITMYQRYLQESTDMVWDKILSKDGEA